MSCDWNMFYLCHSPCRVDLEDSFIPLWLKLEYPIQVDAYGYLVGECKTEGHLAGKVDIMDYIQYLRRLILLLIEFENPDILEVTRDATNYARFCNGLRRHCYEDDDDYVRTIRANCPTFNLRLRWPGQRMRLTFAFKSTNLPQMMLGTRNEILRRFYEQPMLIGS